jgi:hypothetical protein
MAPPSQLAIATSSVQRLVKEEASYHKELAQQEARLEKLLASKDEDENAEYQLKQEASPSLSLVPTMSLVFCPFPSIFLLQAGQVASQLPFQG